jgi:hypothetical protein
MINNTNFAAHTLTLRSERPIQGCELTPNVYVQTRIVLVDRALLTRIQSTTVSVGKEDQKLQDVVIQLVIEEEFLNQLSGQSML